MKNLLKNEVPGHEFDTHFDEFDDGDTSYQQIGESWGPDVNPKILQPANPVQVPLEVAPKFKQEAHEPKYLPEFEPAFVPEADTEAPFQEEVNHFRRD